MTYQPPGGAPPEPTPYAQPQDPWAGGHEPGIAAAPTDPIPQQGFGGGYAPGVATPNVWSQETMAQGGGYPYAAPPKSRIGIYLLVFAAIVVLGGGGGYGAYYVIKHRGGTGTDPQAHNSPTVAPSGDANSASANATPTLEASAVKEGDCIFNVGTAEKPAMQIVPCTKPKSYKVVKIASGVDIPEGPNGKFDRDTTSAQVCKGTNYQAWYGWDSSDDSKDYFFCLTTNP
jgi:hypothetical protein